MIWQIKRPGELINLDEDFTFVDISNKEYGNFNESENEKGVLYDLQRTMIFTLEPFTFYMKSIANEEMALEMRNKKDVDVLLKNFVVGKRTSNLPTGKNTFQELKTPITQQTETNSR